MVPPAHDTVELSVFGCGIGESLAVHYGQGQWMLVDACRSEKRGAPDSLAYLRSIGVDLARDVKIVLATHWHDDHIDGMSQLVKECSRARVFHAAALECDELLQILNLYRSNAFITDKQTSGVRELGSILNVFKNRTAADQSTYANITLADHVLLRDKDIEIVALSPSQSSITCANKELSNMLSELLVSDRPRGVIPSADRNPYSVVLSVRVGTIHLLLGGDLENSADASQGWHAVMQCQCLPQQRAAIYKIAHHGSPNADNNEIWTRLVSDGDPVAVATSYNRGASKRPAPKDITRLLTRTENLFLTTAPTVSSKRRDNAVERELKQIAISRRSLTRVSGHVQIRASLTDLVPVINLFGAARKVSQ